jgi:hypothetical protein
MPIIYFNRGNNWFLSKSQFSLFWLELNTYKNVVIEQEYANPINALFDFRPVIDPCFIGDIFNYHILVDNIAKILPYDKTLRFV